MYPEFIEGYTNYVIANTKIMSRLYSIIIAGGRNDSHEYKAFEYEPPHK